MPFFDTFEIEAVEITDDFLNQHQVGVVYNM